MTRVNSTNDPVPDLARWRCLVLYARRRGLISADEAIDFLTIGELARPRTLSLRASKATTHWTEPQIAAALGVKSVKTARAVLKRMQELGFLLFWRGNRKLPAERWLEMPPALRLAMPPYWPLPLQAPSQVKAEREATPLKAVSSQISGSSSVIALDETASQVTATLKEAASQVKPANESGKSRKENLPESGKGRAQGYRALPRENSLGVTNVTRTPTPADAVVGVPFPSGVDLHWEDARDQPHKMP